MILAFPLAIAYCLYSKDLYALELHKKVSLCIGFFIGVLYTFINLFFTSAYYLAPYSFFLNFLHTLFYDTIIPIALCLVFLFFFIKKTEFKWCELPFMLMGFYCVYFPARLFNVYEVFGSFELFIKPLLTVCMVYASSIALSFLYLYKRKTVQSLFKQSDSVIKMIVIVLLALSFIMPSVIEALHMISIPFFIVLVVSVLYCAAIVYGSILLHKKIKTSI